MENISSVINTYIKGQNRSGINTSIARYIMGHIEEIDRLRVSDVAEACHVSNPSVIRFVREIGFKDYSDFKNALQNEEALHKTETLHTEDISLIQKSREEYLDQVKNWSDEVGKAIEVSLSEIDYELIRKISEDIVDYKYVYCFGTGLSTLFGNFLNQRLSFQMKGLISINSVDFDSPLSDDPKDTLVIMVSQHGNLLRDGSKYTDYFRKNSDKTWLVTQVKKEKIRSERFDEILSIKSYKQVQFDAHILMATAELIGQYCRSISK